MQGERLQEAVLLEFVPECLAYGSMEELSRAVAAQFKRGLIGRRNMWFERRGELT